jgi:predicted dienelactone hydrolase
LQRFEWVLLGVVGVAVYLPVALSTRLRRGAMAGILLPALGVQIIAEGVRWQLWPLYLAAAGLAVGDVLWDERRVRGWPRVRRGLLGIVGVSSLAVLPLALPIPTMPPPSGPYPVGTASYVLVDPDRAEEYGLATSEEGTDEEGPFTPRRLMVQVWYPAVDDPGIPPQVWNPDWDVVGPAMARRLGFPGFFLGHVGDVTGVGRTGLTILSGRLPVVLYSHGWTGFRTIALNQLESLASHGFLVIAPDHAYGAIASRFPDGEVVLADPNALPEGEGVDEDDYQEAAEQLVETFADDLALIVNELSAGEDGPFGALAEHADLEHLGVFGHSTGGGAAVRFCIEGEGCDAVLGQDAWVEPIPDRVVADELSQPSLFFRSEDWIDTPNDRRLRGLAERSEQESYWIGVTGAGHNDFVMTPLFSPVADRLGLKGPIASDRIIPIIDDYLVAFFDRYLYEIGGAVLDGNPPPEVSIEFLP